jgi:hypothetical protein
MTDPEDTRNWRCREAQLLSNIKNKIVAFGSLPSFHPVSMAHIVRSYSHSTECHTVHDNGEDSPVDDQWMMTASVSYLTDVGRTTKLVYPYTFHATDDVQFDVHIKICNRCRSW